MYYTTLRSPVGELLLVGDSKGLRNIGFPTGKGRLVRDPAWSENRDHFETTIRQLTEYFRGDRQRFELSLAPSGTEFQREVLEALQAIPFGVTCSYGDIARSVGRPKAVRAVGAANGRNPLPIVIPCHRVIGADGSLTGFGGGLEAKTWLLNHEGALPERDEKTAQTALF